MSDLDAEGYVTSYDPKYTTRVMLILSLLVMVVLYVEGMLTPSLPAIASDFKVSISQVSLVLSIYLVGAVAYMPIVGKLGDIYGKKKMMSIVIIVYAVAVSVTGFSPNFTFMVASRAVQGIGMTIMPLGMSLVREEFPKDLVPRAQALISAMFGAGFAVSLPLGAFISNYYGWRMTYHTAIPFVLAMAVVTIVVIKESRFKRPGTKIDVVGATLLSSILALFVLALSEGPTWGWYSTGVFSLTAIGVLLIFPLVIYEISYAKKKGDAILNFKLLSKRNVLVANVVICIAGMAMFLSMQALTYRFELPGPSGLGYSILGAGLSLVPFAVGVLIMGPITGYLVTRFGVKPIAIFGAIISAIGFLLQATIPSYIGILIYEFITGAGFSILNGSVINFLVLTVEPKDMGIATSLNGTFRTLGSSIGAPVAGSLMSTFTVSFSHGSLPSHTAYYYIFMIASVAFFLTVFGIFAAREVVNRKGGGRSMRSNAGTFEESSE